MFYHGPCWVSLKRFTGECTESVFLHQFWQFLGNCDPHREIPAWPWPLASKKDVSVSWWQLSEPSSVHLLYLLCLIKSKSMDVWISLSSLITVKLMKSRVSFYFQLHSLGCSPLKHKHLEPPAIATQGRMWSSRLLVSIMESEMLNNPILSWISTFKRVSQA